MTENSIPNHLSSAFDELDEELIGPVQLILSSSTDDRLVGVVNLQHLCDEQSIPFLIHALSDECDDVVFTAVTSLWEIAHQDAVTPLLGCLSSACSDRVRKEALNALKELVNQDHLLLILDRLVTEDVPQQLYLLILLRKIHDVQALPSVAPFLSSDNADLRRESVTTLRYLNQLTHFPPALKLASDPDLEVRKETMLTMAHLDEPDVIKILTESLSNDTSWQVRRNAAQALERKCDPYSAAFLANSIGDEHWQVRKFSLRALNPLVLNEHLPNILPLLCDEYSDVRKEAALALGGILLDQSKAALQQTLDDSDIEVRIAAQKSLAKFQSELKPTK